MPRKNRSPLPNRSIQPPPPRQFMDRDLANRLQTLLGGRFQLTRELPGGGMSRVFLATEPALKRDVVVKVLPPALLSSESLARFEREIEVTASLVHPHILPVISTGAQDDIVYFIAPFLPGESLRTRLAGGPPLVFDAAMRLGEELLEAVAFAHERGIVHRDIKPGNVLLSGGHAVLADFGIARVLRGADDGASPSLTHEPASPYVAPEGIGTPAADEYAAAAVIVAMVAPGALANVAHNGPRIAAQIRATSPRVSHATAQRVAAVLARALAHRPADRHGSVAEFARALRVAAGAPRRGFELVLAGIAATTVIGAILGLRTSGQDLQPQASPPIQLADKVESLAPVATASGDMSLRTAIASAVGSAVAAAAAPTTLDSAEVAMQRWDLAPAADLYARHLQAHPGDSRARLQQMLAQSWMGDSSRAEGVRAAAARVLADDSFDPRSRALAEGAGALADGRFADACAAYQRAHDERADFASALGRAECRANDDLVLTDSVGTRFRGSLAEAATAYRDAIRGAAQTSPAAPVFVYRRLLRNTFIERNRVRRGRGTNGTIYVAFPELVGDSVTFRPRQAGPRTIPPDELQRTERALAAGRDALRPVLVEWTRSSPGDAVSHELLAEILEADGRIAEPGPDGRTALQEIAEARRLLRDEGGAARLARTHVRLLLRRGEFARAAAIADSALRHHELAPASGRAALVSLAALLGRANAATEMLEALTVVRERDLRTLDGSPIELPVAARRLMARFAIRGALGICDEGMKVAPGAIRDALDAIAPASRRSPAVDQPYFERPLSLALSCVGLSAATLIERPSLPVTGAARAIAQGRMDEAVARLQSIDAMRARPGPAEGIEWTLGEASVRLAVGDTSGAIRVLQRTLVALPESAPTFVNAEIPAAGIGRLLVTLADLHVARGEPAEARKHAANAAELWRTADAELQPVVARMRALSLTP